MLLGFLRPRTLAQAHTRVAPVFVDEVYVAQRNLL
jgi:hypothetical protein